MSKALLPEAFRDLEPWSAWSLETENERCELRQASTMAELEALYQALLPRMDEVFSYLDKFPLDELPSYAERLLWLSLSLAEVAPAIEQFGQVQVVEGYDVTRFVARRRG